VSLGCLVEAWEADVTARPTRRTSDWFACGEVSADLANHKAGRILGAASPGVAAAESVGRYCDALCTLEVGIEPDSGTVVKVEIRERFGERGRVASVGRGPERHHARRRVGTAGSDGYPSLIAI